MRKPKHSPPPAPTMKNMRPVGIARKNASAPYQRTPIIAANTASVRPCQKMVGGIMGRGSERSAWPHPIDTQHGKEAA